MRFALITAAALAMGLPAAAQTYTDDGSYVDEVVVAGRHIPGDGPSRLSRTVNLRDLNLTTPEGQQLMKLRVRDTAHDLCRDLGEGPGNGGPLLRSCEDEAVRGARPQMKLAVNQAFARASAYAYLDTPYAPYPY